MNEYVPAHSMQWCGTSLVVSVDESVSVIVFCRCHQRVFKYNSTPNLFLYGVQIHPVVHFDLLFHRYWLCRRKIWLFSEVVPEHTIDNIRVRTYPTEHRRWWQKLDRVYEPSMRHDSSNHIRSDSVKILLRKMIGDDEEFNLGDMTISWFYPRVSEPIDFFIFLFNQSSFYSLHRIMLIIEMNE